MSVESSALPGSMIRDAARLAMAYLETAWEARLAWDEADAAALLGAASRQLTRQADAARILAPTAPGLIRGIEPVSFLETRGPFGPAWSGHPFASGAMDAGYRLREPDLTRALAALMGPAAGRRGPQRAVGFLRLLTELTGAEELRATLSEGARPTVSAEHPVTPSSPRILPGTAVTRLATRRIDLLFEWSLGPSNQRAVVVVEAKLGAVVGEGQLLAYREEARRRAKGGPTALILLTDRPDAAERRYRAWKPVRWFALLRRWEAVLAATGDDDPEFARVRAHLWRHVLASRRAEA